MITIILVLLVIIVVCLYVMFKQDLRISQLEGQRDGWMHNFEDVRRECQQKDRTLVLMQRREKALLDHIANEALVKVPPIFAVPKNK